MSFLSNSYDLFYENIVDNERFPDEGYNCHSLATIILEGDGDDDDGDYDYAPAA